MKTREITLGTPERGKYTRVQNRGVLGWDFIVDGIWTVKPGESLYVAGVPLLDENGVEVDVVWIVRDVEAERLAHEESKRVELERRKLLGEPPHGRS